MQLKYLKNIQSPEDIRDYSIDELKELCDEIRDYTIDTVTTVGGHLAPTLGAIELTVALHHVFNTPKDKLIWDVGHQAYAHKILTGRLKSMNTIRQFRGLSGFLKRTESEYDVFGAGHASTSISAALGVAAARDQKNKDYIVAAVIGDGNPIVRRGSKIAISGINLGWKKIVFFPVDVKVITEHLPTSLPVPAVVGTANNCGIWFLINLLDITYFEMFLI